MFLFSSFDDKLNYFPSTGELRCHPTAQSCRAPFENGHEGDPLRIAEIFAFQMNHGGGAGEVVQQLRALAPLSETLSVVDTQDLHQAFHSCL